MKYENDKEFSSKCISVYKILVLQNIYEHLQGPQPILLLLMGPLNNQRTGFNKLTLITSSFIFLFLFMIINTVNVFPSYSPPSRPPRYETRETQETKNDDNTRVAHDVSKPMKDYTEYSLPSTTSDHDHDHQYQVLYIKNTPPFFLDKERLLPPPPHDKIMNERKRKTTKVMIAKERKKKRPRKVISSEFKTRPFMVMLPKGFVPPSGASHCHNSNPNSKVTFYCEFSSTPKP